MNEIQGIKKASTIAGVHRNTGSKYLKAGKLPREIKKCSGSYTRPSIISDADWEYLKKILEASPELEATAAMEHLMEVYPQRYSGKELRSLQRKMKDWKVLHGKEREVMFWQIYRPGERSQSDFIDMDYLGLTIGGKQFDHLFFHFMLPYSSWEDVLICEGGESFDNLCRGYESSLWKLRGVPKIHRTDNLSAAITASTRNFTDSWNKVMKHYNVEPTVNNPGKSNENGKVERSNGAIKRSIENHLALRGSKDFKEIQDYQKFIDAIVEKRNKSRLIKVQEERQELQPLPNDKWYTPSKIPVKVSSDSTIRVDGASYSVPSRTIGCTLSAYLYPDKVEVYYGKHMLEVMPRFKKGETHINFMHIIHSLRSKPGAFEDYKYKESLYPTRAFRQIYDKLRKVSKSKHVNKQYIELLYLASVYSVEEVSSILDLFLRANIMPKLEEIRNRLAYKAVTIPDIFVRQTNLKEYDELLADRQQQVIERIYAD